MYVVAIPFAGLAEGSPVYPSKTDVASLLERGLIKEVSESEPAQEVVKPAKVKEKKKEAIQPEVVDDSKLIKA